MGGGGGVLEGVREGVWGVLVGVLVCDHLNTWSDNLITVT